MIREATQADIPRIVEIGSNSLADGPYRDIIADKPEQSAKLAIAILASDKGKILLWENEAGKVVGLLAFLVSDHYFTGEPTANEIMWYVEKEERAGCPAIRLIWAAETAAKAMGATYFGFTAPTSEVESLYKRFGYQQIEVSYGKKL